MTEESRRSAHAPTPAAKRQRRRRARVRRGVAVFRIEAPHDALAEYLIRMDRIFETAAEDHIWVERALAKVVRDLIERSKESRYA